MKVCSVCLRCFEESIILCPEESHGSLTEARAGNCSLIDGYRFESLLEADALGEIYLAVNSVSGEKCLVGITAVDLFANKSEIQARFLRETQIAAQIEHPGVARIFESGILPDESLYVVSEFVAGETLSERLQTGKPFAEISAVGIARQAAEALEAIHAAHLAHRNLNPQNIIISAEGKNDAPVTIKNIDFAGVREQFACSGIAADEIVLGRLRYFSPEQCARRQAIEPVTDIYSLGIVLFEMLHGKVPFNAPNAEEIMAKHLGEPLPFVRISNFEVRALLTHTLSQSLQKTTDARIKSANSFARQLRHIEQYASRSYSLAVIERLLTDKKAKTVSQNRSLEPVKQSKENVTARSPFTLPEVVEHPNDLPAIELKKISAAEHSEPIVPVYQSAQNDLTVEAKEDSADETSFFSKAFAAPVSAEYDELQCASGSIGNARFLSVQPQQSATPHMVTVEEAEKYLDEQMTRLLGSDEPKSGLDSYSPVEAEAETEEYEDDDRYRLPDTGNLISMPGGKIYVGAAAALVLLILTGAMFLSGRFSSGAQTPARAAANDSEVKENGETRESITQTETPESAAANSETAVIEMPELPDSSTFAAENQPVNEKISAIKTMNKNAAPKKTASAEKTNSKKNAAASAEKTAAQTDAARTVFPAVKIVIGKGKKSSPAPDVLSRPRIVQKSADLRVF